MTAAFAKEFAKRGIVDKVLGEIKRKLHEKAVSRCDDVLYTPKDMELILILLKKGPDGFKKNKPIAKL
jgi:hypothetical protein